MKLQKATRYAVDVEYKLIRRLNERKGDEKGILGIKTKLSISCTMITSEPIFDTKQQIKHGNSNFPYKYRGGVC